MARLKEEGKNYRECLQKMNEQLKKEQLQQMEEINKVISGFQNDLVVQFQQKKNENYNLVRYKKLFPKNCIK